MRMTPALKLCNPARVIEMHMRVQDELHIFNPEAEDANVIANLLCRFRQPAVDEYVP